MSNLFWESASLQACPFNFSDSVYGNVVGWLEGTGEHRTENLRMGKISKVGENQRGVERTNNDENDLTFIMTKILDNDKWKEMGPLYTYYAIVCVAVVAEVMKMFALNANTRLFIIANYCIIGLV